MYADSGDAYMYDLLDTGHVCVRHDSFISVPWHIYCCSELQSAAGYWGVLQGGAVYCSVVQCVAVCCSVLQCGAVWCSVLISTRLESQCFLAHSSLSYV